MTAAEIRREVLRQLKKHGCDGYTPNPPASVDNTPRCVVEGCERIASQRGKRCMACSEEHRLASERRRKAEWHQRERDKKQDQRAA